MNVLGVVVTLVVHPVSALFEAMIQCQDLEALSQLDSIDSQAYTVCIEKWY